jgi:hypothetical protein
MALNHLRFAIIAPRNIYKINKKKFWHWFVLSVKVDAETLYIIYYRRIFIKGRAMCKRE